ncbi:MAG: hypothetical protein ACYC2K_01580, partial [Gemmatimonadales bacterium]
MSITALTMLSSAMRKMQQLGADESPTAQEASDGLYAMNAMLDLWSIERLMVYQVQQASYSWSAGAASKTIGSGGDFDTSRPATISKVGNFFRDSNSQDHALTVLPREYYDRLGDKTTGSSIPEYLFYDDGFPTRTLYAHPVPSETLTLYLNSWKALQAFSSLTTVLSLPPGYQVAIETNLAVFWAPEFGAAASNAVQTNGTSKMATLAKAAIKGVNQPSLVAEVDPALVGIGGRRSRIES